MRKKGQAAMEFLMTYGWAILVVLVVIGALAYFGVLNPQQFLPKKCQFSTGLTCVDHIVRYSDDTMDILISNGLGNDIRVTDLEFIFDNGIECLENGIDVVIAAGKESRFEDIDCGTGSLAPSDLEVGVRIKGDMTLSYNDLQTQFDHDVAGTMLTDIE